jgi:hypothetical protein
MDNGVFWQRCFDVETDTWMNVLFNCPYCKHLKTEPSDFDLLIDRAIALQGTALKKLETHLDESSKLLRQATELQEQLPDRERSLVSGSAVLERIQQKSSALSLSLNHFNPFLTDQ